MYNEILFRRRNKMFLNTGSGADRNTIRYIATVLKNMESYGYTVSEEVLNVIKTYNANEVFAFYSEFENIIMTMTGANYSYEPMYSNFPSEVMEMNDATLYINAIAHYLTYGKLRSVNHKNNRLPLFDELTIKVIDLADSADIDNIMCNIMSSKSSLSQQDKNDLLWYFESHKENAIIPEEIPSKENSAYVCMLYINNASLVNYDIVRKYIRTATDVLRLATAMSGGDISLSENTKFKSMSRKNRRFILSLLNSAPNLEEDMKRYKNRWIRLGEILHPYEYSYYSWVNTAFRKLRENEHIDTFGGKFNSYMDSHDYPSALLLLKTRAGEFARKLDYLLRTVKDKNSVVNSFAQIANSVSTPVLLQVKNYFDNRNNPNEYRVFFPKGNLAKSKVITNELPHIPNQYCRMISQICKQTLIAEYQKRDFLGMVYLDEEFENYYVPFSQRNASNAMRTVVRGSKIALNENKPIIRSFIHWKNTSDDEWNCRVDIDLSAVVFDKDWGYKEHISYTNLRSDKYFACHSGDITDAPNGACEFIDIDCNAVINQGGRYVVFNVNSFTGQNFTDVPELFVGWMERETMNSGEIFEAATVKNRIDLTANTRISIPMILDVVDKRIIWADMSLKNNPDYSINIENNMGGIVATCMALTNMQKTTMYELIDLNIQARGLRSYNCNESDVAFVMEIPENKNEKTVYITPYMLDIFTGKYL